MTVRTAIVAAAGGATRMWPSSKAFPKECFPLGRIPAIVQLVWEFQEAGIERVVLVASERSEGPLRRLFEPGALPTSKLERFPEVIRFQETLEKVRFDIILQEGPYGNGTPLVNALDLVGAEPCIYAFGDDIVLGENPTAALLDLHARKGAPAIAVQPVPLRRVRQFGIAETKADGPDWKVTRFVEKPLPGETSSRLAAFGRYLVPPELSQILRGVEAGKDGELWFTDALVAWLRSGRDIWVHPLSKGRWYTVGDPSSYAAAVRAAVALQTR